MKNIERLQILLGLIALSLVAALYAVSPTYTGKSAGGNATTGATVIFAADPSSQIRVVSLNWQSDSNTAVASFNTGVGAYTVSVTNAATSSVTNQISTTNGLVAASTIILNHLGVPYNSTISSFNSNATWGCYYVLPSGGWGVATSVNDNLYQCGTALTLPIGATTNSMQGEALYVGNPGRPVVVTISPSAVTNRINSAVARYE